MGSGTTGGHRGNENLVATRGQLKKVAQKRKF